MIVSSLCVSIVLAAAAAVKNVYVSDDTTFNMTWGIDPTDPFSLRFTMTTPYAGGWVALGLGNSDPHIDTGAHTKVCGINVSCGRCACTSRFKRRRHLRWIHESFRLLCG
jgi:hypothetical protein